MGMSSSQARLLHLTSRMHQIEYKAAKLEAEKLQMANESARAYDEYLEALEDTKIQYKAIDTNGSIVYHDANMNILQNGVIAGYADEHSERILFLQRQNGTMMVTRAVADAYGITGGVETRDMDTYIEETTGLTKSPIYGTKWIEDTTQIVGFTPIANSNYVSCGVDSYTYDNVAVNATKTVTQTSDDELVAGTTYTVSTAEDLKHLARLINDGQDSTNVTIVLTNNIDMSGVADYVPIGTGNTFKGTFDGNGYTISNLTVNRTGNVGLFGIVEGGTIKNVNLTNANITTTGMAGGIAAQIHSGSTVNNCSVQGSISGGGYTGGLVGAGWKESPSKSNITNCYVNATVRTSGRAVGGAIGYVGNVNMSNCLALGTVSGVDYAGGFIGEIYDQGGATGSTPSVVNNCYTTASVTSGSCQGSFIGRGTSDLTITNSGTGLSSLPFAGSGSYTNNQTPISNPTNFTSHSANTTGATPMSDLGKSTTTTSKTIPSINADCTGGYYSNILAVLNKAGMYDSNTNTPADIPNKVKAFLLTFANNDADNSRLWHLNEQLVNYLNTGNGTNAFTTALSSDINAGASNATNAYQNVGTTVNATRQTNDTSWTPTYHAATKGSLTIPNVATIKSGVESAFKKAGISITTAQIDAFFNQYNIANADDLAYLANINDIVNDYANTNSVASLTALQTAITNGQKMQNLPAYIANPADYNITMNPNAQTVNVSYKQVEVEDTTNVIGEKWDTTNPVIANAMSMWKFLQKGVEIVEEPLASSSEYLKNLLETGEVVLTTYNPANQAQMNALTPDQILNMSDSEYDEIMEIENTNVAVETALREVSNESNLKKAEAEYEANMRKIDMKDRKFDQDLAALDAERNAVKSEIETLKTVANENVERTFKLFG